MFQGQISSDPSAWSSLIPASCEKRDSLLPWREELAILAWPLLLEGCSDSEHQQREPGTVQSLGLGTPHHPLGAEAVLLPLARDMLFLPGLLLSSKTYLYAAA